jgi:hypothetical protein
MQDRKLAQEGLWAHPTEVPEVGGLLIAQPHAPELLGDARYWQLVIFLLEHGARGSRGVILNRPAAAKVGDLLQWGYTSTQVSAGCAWHAHAEQLTAWCASLLSAQHCLTSTCWVWSLDQLCPNPAQSEESEAGRIERAFADCQVYLGGFYPPNRIARQPITLMHGQGHLEDSHEILPGIYIGGGACCGFNVQQSLTVLQMMLSARAGDHAVSCR